MTDEPLDPPTSVTSKLAEAFPSTGLWPLLWHFFDDPVSYSRDDFRVHEAVLDRVDAAAVLRVAWESWLPGDDRYGPPGPFPGLAPGSYDGRPASSLGDPFQYVNGHPEPRADGPGRQLLLVPCTRPADVLTALGWDFSQIPTWLTTAVLRSWEERFAAVPVELEPSAFTLSIGAPVAEIEHAYKLAAEMAAIVAGPPLPGWPLSGLANQLLTGMVSSDDYSELTLEPTLWRFITFFEEVNEPLWNLATSVRG